jgi:DNA polymerase-3 subunit delta
MAEPRKKPAPKSAAKKAGPRKVETDGPVEGFIALMGSDESEVKRHASEMAKVMTPPESGDFGLEIIDGDVNTVDEALEAISQTCMALRTLPFFGRKLVWLKSATFLRDDVTGRSERVIDDSTDILAVLAEGLPEGVTFLLSAVEPDKRRAFYKTVSKMTKIHVFDKLDTSRGGWENEALALVRDHCERLGIRLEPRALEHFVALVGGDTRQTINELEKLAIYLGERDTATWEDIDLMVPRSRGSIVFELGNAIAQRKVARAVALAETLLDQGETAIALLYASIIPTVRNLLLARDLLIRNNLRPPEQPWAFGKTLEKLPAASIAHLPRKKDGTLSTWGLAAAAKDCMNFTAEELHRGLEACLRANRQLVSTSLDPRVVISSLVTSLVA